jgi:hypothetical protein
VRAAWATALGAVLLLATARVGVAPAEHCPVVGVAEARATIAAGVGWLAGGQAADGMFTYSNVLPGYNVVRHAGVLLSLEHAAGIGVDGAAAAGDAGRAWAVERLVPAGGGVALPELDGTARTGASALFTRALLLRQDRTGSSVDDEVLRGLGRFLASQVVDGGAVSSRWDPATDAPVPGVHDRFFTGQVLWALHGLIDAGLADEGVDEAAAAVGEYLPRRDGEEHLFPPVSDHWGAYAYDGLGLDRLSPEQRAHAERLVGVIGVQVRGESTRWRGGIVGALRGGTASGSGLGTLGEGGLALLRLLGPDRAPGLDVRMRCVAGMLVERQEPDGGWYRDGVTRMDDQQHAISALVAALPLLAEPADVVGGGEQPHSLAWLVLLGAAAAWPVRRTPAAVPGVVAAAVLVLLSGPILDALDISPASSRAAAGVALGVAALGVLAAPAAAATLGVVAATGAVLAVGVGADDGAPALLAVGVAAVVVFTVPDRLRGPVGARVGAVGALLLAADLVVDGVMGV